MAEFVSDCPRCGAARVTHDVYSSVVTSNILEPDIFHAEISCLCRACKKLSLQEVLINVQQQSSVKVRLGGSEGTANSISSVAGSIDEFAAFLNHIRITSPDVPAAPEFLPTEIERVLFEANTCLVNECWNAAGAMYRLTLDLSTKSLLPAEGEPSSKIRRSLGLRLKWLFETSKLDIALRDLAECIQQDGNDGSHDGSLSKEEAEDLRDFCYELLERVFTNPKRLESAKIRRADRRQKNST